MKATVFYLFGNEVGGTCRQYPDRIWWPDEAHEITVDVRSPASNVIVADPEAGPSPDEMLEAAAEQICIAEYNRTKDSTRDHMRNDTDLMVYVSHYRDVPGKLFRTTLYLEPSAVAYPKEATYKPVRLPNAAELAEAGCCDA